MVRVRVGTTWKQDPALRAALARGGEAAERAAAGVVDALAIEVDGVDIVAGRAEGAVLGGVEGLGRAVLRLLAGAPRAEVHFSEGGLELLLARRAASALLTVVSLGRPARVLARDVEVELADLARATREAAAGLADELDAVRPVRPPGPGGALRQLAARLERAEPRPAETPPGAAARPHPPARPRAGAPTCAFELRDDAGVLGSYRGPGADLGALLAGGRVLLRTADGRDIAAPAGPPFLVLRDLSAFAGEVADAARRGEALASAVLAGAGRHATLELEADLRAGTVARDRGAPLACPPLLLARAILEAAIDFCGVVAARNAWQAENAWLLELRAGSAERLAHVHELVAGDVLADAGPAVRTRRAPRLPGAPLGPGRVRRVAFRRTWEADVGAPAGFGVLALGDGLIAAGAAAVAALDAAGGERWRRPGVNHAVASGGALLLLGGGALHAVDPASGRTRWSAGADALPEGARDVVRLAGGVALVLAPGAARALDPGSGAPLWTFAPPAALELRAAALGALAVVGSDAGFLYGLEAATGRQAWRVRLPGPLAAPPVAYRGEALVACVTSLGGSLIALDPATGRRRFEQPLDVTPTAAPLPFAGLLAVPGTVAGDPVITAIAPDGALAWEDAPPLGGAPVALAASSAALLAKTSHGACVALDRAGGTRWSRAGTARHPPPGNVAPLVARGLALVAAEGVEALDAATGEALGQAPLPAPVRLAADGALRLWSMDAGGVVTAVQLTTHLSVV